MSRAGIEAWNTRIFRRDTPAGAAPEYDLRIASAHTRPGESHSLEVRTSVPFPRTRYSIAGLKIH